MASDELRKLLLFLGSLPCGPIDDFGQEETISKLLSACWDEFTGSHQTAMEGWKLLNGRMEKLSWSKPVLTFRIERHGGLVQGSTRAEVYRWEVNTEEMTATIATRSTRQVKKMAARVSTKIDAERIAQAILNHDEGEAALCWKNENKVKVEIGEIYPDLGVVKRTLSGRRKRFWAKLTELLKPHGWVRAGQHLQRTSVDTNINPN